MIFKVNSRNKYLLMHWESLVRELILLGEWMQIIQVIISFVGVIPGFSYLSTWNLSPVTSSVRKLLSNPRLAPKLLP